MSVFCVPRVSQADPGSGYDSSHHTTRYATVRLECYTPCCMIRRSSTLLLP